MKVNPMDIQRVSDLSVKLTLKAAEITARSERGDMDVDWLRKQADLCLELVAQLQAHAIMGPSFDAERRRMHPGTPDTSGAGSSVYGPAGGLYGALTGCCCRAGQNHPFGLLPGGTLHRWLPLM